MKLEERKEKRFGQEKGEKNEKIKIAKELLKLGIKIEDIEKATGLSKEEINKLSAQKD